MTTDVLAEIEAAVSADPSPAELQWRISWMAGTAPRPEPAPRLTLGQRFAYRRRPTRH